MAQHIKTPEIFQLMTPAELITYQRFITQNLETEQLLRYLPEIDSFEFTQSGGFIRREILQRMAGKQYIIKPQDCYL